MDSKALAERIKMQGEAKAAIRAANYNGGLIVTVGGGKGKVMIDLAMELLKYKKIKNVLYLCNSASLRDSETDGFPQELEKWGTNELKKITHLECYQTAHRWKGKEFDLVLGDEIDFALSPEYIKVFFNNKFKYRIVVSGTLSSEKKKLLTSIVPIVYKLTTTKAEEREIINKTQYFVYNYRLNPDEIRQYRKWTLAYAKQSAAEATPQTLNFLLGKRKEVLYNLDSSVINIRKIMQWLWNRNKKTRLIIFAERTAQADRLCKYSYHGGNEDLNNWQRFQDEEISGIAVVGKVKRGTNPNKVDAGIFESLTGSQTEFEQRNGRLKRLMLTQLATVIFMCPWYSFEDKDGNTIWKPTIVDTWITNATANLKGIQINNLKL